MAYVIRTEVYVNESAASATPALTSGWVPLPARWSDGITIQRGYSSESSSTPSSSRCDFTVKDNRDGTWTGPNPASPYYGRFGQGSPLRVLVDRVIDPFTRSVSNSWGSTPATSPTGALAWSQFGASSAASDWSVSGTTARHSIDAANETRFSWLPGAQFTDCEVSVDFTVPITVTGASVKSTVLLRGEEIAGVPQGIRVEIDCAPSSSESLTIRDANGTQYGASSTAFLTGPTGRIRCQVEGQTVRAKVWDPAARGEPQGWDLIVSDPGLTAASPVTGWVGVRSAVSTGNTNAKPIVFSYDNFTASLPRYAGTLADPEQTTGGHPNDTDMKVSAAGVIQAQGLRKAPALSALRRAITQGSVQPVGYWPMEDSSGSTSLASGLSGGRRMTYAGGATTTVKLADNDDVLGSLPVPTFDGPLGSYFVSSIPVGGLNSATAEELLAFVTVVAPAGGVAVANQILNVRMTGTQRPIGQLMIELQPSGECRLRVRDWFGLDILVSAVSSGFALNGRPALVGFSATQSGGNVNWTLFRYYMGGTSPVTLSGTMTSTSIGAATNVAVGLGGSLGGTALGQATVYSTGASVALTSALLLAVNGNISETAGARIKRLMAEDGRDFSYTGDVLNGTGPMGPQPAKTVDDLIDECVDVDMGLVYEARSGELAYTTRSSMYHQTRLVTLEYGRGGGDNDLIEPFAIRGNDQLVVNDVTLKREGGSEYRAVLDSGPRSVAAVGTRDESHTINVYQDSQLEDQAWWRVALGTVPSMRVATLSLHLGRAPVASRLHELAAIGIGTRIQLSNTPPWAPPEIISSPRELIVLGVKENLDQAQWTVQLICMPGELFNVPVTGPATGETKVDTDDSFVAANATSTATSISVASTWLWTTSGAQMPIQIEIGGEILTVTAISGASSPQTFTVTRSVNGVVKSIFQNETVQLRTKPRFGY